MDLFLVPFSPFPASPVKSSKETLVVFFLELVPVGAAGHLQRHRESWNSSDHSSQFGNQTVSGSQGI